MLDKRFGWQEEELEFDEQEEPMVQKRDLVFQTWGFGQTAGFFETAEDADAALAVMKALPGSRTVVKADASVRISKPETTDAYHRIPVQPMPANAEIRTITISEDQGIKALEDIRSKKVVTYLFDTDKWTMGEAREWIEEHKDAVEKGGEGSGNFGHEGIPGEVGGSGPGGGGLEGRGIKVSVSSKESEEVIAGNIKELEASLEKVPAADTEGLNVFYHDDQSFATTLTRESGGLINPSRVYGFNINKPGTPNDGLHVKGNVKQNEDVVLHEVGHSVWHGKLSETERGNWDKYYRDVKGGRKDDSLQGYTKGGSSGTLKEFFANVYSANYREKAGEKTWGTKIAETEAGKMLEARLGVKKGGPGSGHFGHEGVPEKVEKTTTKFRFLKIDKKEHIVGGLVYEPNVRDTQDDYTDAPEIQKAMYRFMLRYAVDQKRIKVMHKGQAHYFPILEVFQPEHDTKKGDQVIPAGSWWMMVKVTSPDVWTEVEEGRLTGFSIGGRASTP